MSGEGRELHGEGEFTVRREGEKGRRGEREPTIIRPTIKNPRGLP